MSYWLVHLVKLNGSVSACPMLGSWTAFEPMPLCLLVLAQGVLPLHNSVSRKALSQTHKHRPLKLYCVDAWHHCLRHFVWRYDAIHPQVNDHIASYGNSFMGHSWSSCSRMSLEFRSVELSSFSIYAYNSDRRHSPLDCLYRPSFSFLQPGYGRRSDAPAHSVPQLTSRKSSYYGVQFDSRRPHGSCRVGV